jgi:hypothetical protein
MTLQRPLPHASRRGGGSYWVSPGQPQAIQQGQPPEVAQSGEPSVAKPLPGAARDKPSILIFGRDLTLLQTRQLILSRHGYVTLVATDLSGVERSLRENPIRLLILCYTLDALESARSLELARERPATQSLLLVHGESDFVDDGSPHVADVLKGPGKLLSSVDELLNCCIDLQSYNS